MAASATGRTPSLWRPVPAVAGQRRDAGTRPTALVLCRATRNLSGQARLARAAFARQSRTRLPARTRSVRGSACGTEATCVALVGGRPRHAPQAVRLAGTGEAAMAEGFGREANVRRCVRDPSCDLSGWCAGVGRILSASTRCCHKRDEQAPLREPWSRWLGCAAPTPSPLVQPAALSPSSRW